MAFIMEPSYLCYDSDEKVWEELYSPGEEVEVSGIYICTVCGKEITSNEGDPFPPQNHHQHKPQKNIEWKLIVRTNTKGNNSN